jgi:hypothetical protein
MLQALLAFCATRQMSLTRYRVRTVWSQRVALRWFRRPQGLRLLAYSQRGGRLAVHVADAGKALLEPFLCSATSTKACAQCIMQTSKSPSRCAFEAGHSALAARLQAWEEGNEEYAKHENGDSTIPNSDASKNSDEEKPKEVNVTRARGAFLKCFIWSVLGWQAQEAVVTVRVRHRLGA